MGTLFYIVGSLFRAVGNVLRRTMRAPDFVVLTLEGPYPELKQPPRNLLQRALRPSRTSLQELAEQFRRPSLRERGAL